MHTEAIVMFAWSLFPFSRRLVLSVSVGGGIALAAALAIGANPMSSSLTPERLSDEKLATRIHAAIANDPELKKYHLNMLVNVVDGSAVIGGPVPDRALLPKVEAVAKAVPGVRDVKVSVWVPTGGGKDPLARKVADVMAAKPVRVEPAVVAKPAGTIPMLFLPLEPLPEVQSGSVAPASPAPVLVRHQPGGLLLEPIAPGANPKTDAPVRSTSTTPSIPGLAPLPYATIPPTRLPTVPPSPTGLPEGNAPKDLTPETPATNDPIMRAIDDVRQQDRRFAGLRVEMRGKTAIIRGHAADDMIPWDFAGRLRKLPGIDRVILGEVVVK